MVWSLVTIYLFLSLFFFQDVLGDLGVTLLVSVCSLHRVPLQLILRHLEEEPSKNDAVKLLRTKPSEGALLVPTYLHEYSINKPVRIICR